LTPEQFLKIRAFAARWPVVLAAYTVLAVLAFANVWSDPGGRWIGVDGDPDSTMWSLSWAAYSLSHLLNPFITNWIFFPTGTDVLWSNADAPIALGWVVSPITYFLGPVLAYNLLQTLCFSLSAFVAYLAFARLVQRRAAAFVGGLVYGFGPYMFGQAYGHMALTFAVVPPLIFILVERLVVSRDISPWLAGAAAGIALAFQLLVSEEVAATTVIVTVIAVLWLAATALITRRRVPWLDVLRRTVCAGLAAAGVFVVLAAYPIYVIFRGPDRITHTPVRTFGFFATDIYNLIVPPGTTHLLHNSWTEQTSALFPGGPVEAGGYLGIALIGVIIYTTLRWFWVPAVIFTAGAGALVLLISLGPHLVHQGHYSSHITLPWVLVANVPVLNDVLVERMALYVDLFAGLMLALFLDRSWAVPGVTAKVGAVVAAAASLLLLAPNVPWVTSTSHVPELFQPGTLANRYFHAKVPEGAVALVLPADLVQKDHGYTMLWQATDLMHFKSFGGDLVHGDPRGYGTMDPQPSTLWSAVQALQAGQLPPMSDAYLHDARSDLDAMQIRAVVLGPMPRPDLAEQYFDRVLGTQPVNTGSVLIWLR
jgi:hypothetical protein